MGSWYLLSKKGANTSNFISLIECIKIYKNLIATGKVQENGPATRRLEMLQDKLDGYHAWKKKPYHVRKAIVNPLKN